MRQPGTLLVAFSVICCLLVLTANAQEQALQPVTPLQPGTPIERQIGTGQSYTFNVELETNQFAQLVVDQRGIDLVVKVSAPDGKSLGDFDSPSGDNGLEEVSFIAATAGTYRISVSPLNDAGSGKFEIKLVELREATEQELKAGKNAETVKTKGIALLAEVEGLIPELHSPQSRIRAQFQTAQILWHSDEKRAWKYMNDASAGLKEFLATTDPGSQEYYRNYSAITQLRAEMLHMMASSDPEAALNFLYSSKPPASPYGNERDAGEQERSLELSIVNQVLDKDPKRALQIARQNLKQGFSTDLVNTVYLLRQKNPELATELATEIANKVLGEKLLKNPGAASLTASLISVCNSQPSAVPRSDGVASASPQVLPEQTCRDLLQRSIEEAMSYQPPAATVYSSEREAAWNLLNGLRAAGANLDANFTGGAATIEKKIAEMNNARNPFQETSQQLQTSIDGGSVDGALELVQKTPQENRQPLYEQLANMVAAKGDLTRARQILNDYVTNPYQRRQALANIDQQELGNSISHGKVEDALRVVAALKTPRERASMLRQIVQQIGHGQKRASAVNLLEQARSLLASGPQAQDQEQMFTLLELARAMSHYDVKRAFDILDPLVDQLNDLCAAARTLDGFGSASFDNDELDLLNGNNIASIVVQISNTLGTLAMTNFERAKVTSDRLRPPEVRLRAYLEIAQQTIQSSK